jgi:dipeptidyl aminopeptidase/acylaminoacyl peptidase
MKQILSAVLLISMIFFSCKKEYNERNGNNAPGSNGRGLKGPNRPPVANAGADQVITLPSNSVNLDGSASTDPNNNITSYAWTKISGPSSFTIANANAAQTQVTNLIEGVYEFELKVTDAKGLFDKDIMQVTVQPQPPPPPPCPTCKILFVSARDGNNEIYKCNTDGSNITRLTNDPGSDEQPVWSPDGTRIAFTRSLGGYSTGLYIMNADGSNVVQTTSGNVQQITGLTWSPDGTKIAYSGYTYYSDRWYGDWEEWSFYVVNATSGSSLQLDLGGAATSQPAWSPDGTKIALTVYNDIYTMNSDGTGLTPLTVGINSGYDNFYSPSWSPNGAKLAVVFSGGSSSNIPHVSVINSDGSGLTLLRPGVGNTSWSADGTIIVYTSWSGSISNVSWVAADGSTGGTIVTDGWDADWQH